VKNGPRQQSEDEERDAVRASLPARSRVSASRINVTLDPATVVARRAASALRGSGVEQASKFVGRLALMESALLTRSIAGWRAESVDGYARWLRAERAVAHGVESTHRQAQESRLLGHLDSALCRRPLGSLCRPATGTRTEPSSDYVAAMAMLALLVRDVIEPAHFDVLYLPFREIVAEQELERE